MPDPESPTTPTRWADADAAFAALETALKAPAVDSASGDGFRIATSHLHKVTDMRARFAERRMVVDRAPKGG